MSSSSASTPAIHFLLPASGRDPCICAQQFNARWLMPCCRFLTEGARKFLSDRAFACHIHSKWHRLGMYNCKATSVAA